MEPLHSSEAPDDPWRVHRRREPLRPASPPWLRPGLRTAAIAAAATAGVLVRFGVASGIGPFGVFLQAGRLVLGVARTDGPLAHLLATLAGLLVHVAVATAWALAYARLVAGRNAAVRWLAAVGVAGLAWGVGQLLLLPMLQLGHGARALPPQVVLLHVVLALSLAIGMRLALREGDEP